MTRGLLCRALFDGNYADDTFSHSPKQTHTRPIAQQWFLMQYTGHRRHVANDEPRLSLQSRRDQRLQTGALHITRLDLFHDAPVTGRKKPTHLPAHMEAIAHHPQLITATSEDLKRKCFYWPLDACSGVCGGKKGGGVFWWDWISWPVWQTLIFINNSWKRDHSQNAVRFLVGLRLEKQKRTAVNIICDIVQWRDLQLPYD